MIWTCILLTIFLVITIYVVSADFAGKILGIIAIIFVATSLMIAAIKNLSDLFFKQGGKR